MITFEKAKQKALKDIPNADTVVEYEDAYVFYNAKNHGAGDEDSEVVILKDNGNIVTYSEYIMSTKVNGNNKKVTKI